MNEENLQVLTNIMGAVESGGQEYGKRDYARYTPPKKNTPKEVTCTLGWYQAYGHEARQLIQAIFDADKAAFWRLDNAGIEDMLLYNWEAIEWKPSAKEKAALIALIDSPVGHEVQDKIFAEKMPRLIADCEKDYPKADVKAQMMYCEIRHLGGKGPVDRIFGRTDGKYDLDSIMASLVKDQKSSNKNLVGSQKFWSRHLKCREFIDRYAKEEKLKITEKDIILCGHGSGNPRTIRMDIYLSERYSRTASATIDGKKYTWNKGVVAVVRPKALTDALRSAYVRAYATILGRNIYSQSLRLYCYTPYKNGKYYSDCSASQCLTLKQIGLSMSALNTVGMYKSDLFEKVPVKIKNGHILNPEILKVGDQLLFAGDDYYRELHIGHVEGIYSIAGSTGDATKGVEGFQTWMNRYYPEICKTYTGAELVVDGVFGEKTRRAAITLWKYMINGYYGGRLTLGNYNFFESSKKAAEQITIEECRMHGTLTAILQGLLAREGLYSGDMTAKVDTALQKAVTQYNAAKGIKTDALCADTWHKLFN